jgi:hypothetical protein
MVSVLLVGYRQILLKKALVIEYGKIAVLPTEEVPKNALHDFFFAFFAFKNCFLQCLRL